jgi:ribonuclease P protein component
MVVAKKKLDKAVDRNRLKRIIMESFRRSDVVSNGQDIVVLANFGVKGKSNTQLFKSLTKHWEQLKNLCTLVNHC